MTTAQNLFLAIHPDSQLAKLLTRLAHTPTMKSADVSRSWQQKAKEGGTTELSGSRAAFLLDAIGEAVEGTWPEKTGRGEVVIPGVAKALVSAIPAMSDAPIDHVCNAGDLARLQRLIDKAETELKQANNVAGTRLDHISLLHGQIEQLQAELKEARARVTVAADKVVIKGAGDDKPDLTVPTVFPEAPVNRASLGAKFITPSWFAMMKAALDSGRHVSIAGPPGPGKSTAPEEYFIAKGQPFVVVNAEGGMRRRDLEGTKEIAPGRSFFQCAEFAAAAIFGWACILNEVNAAEPDALLLINGVIEVPNAIAVNGKTYPVHPNFRLVVTYNPGLTGTKPLPPAFKDRFFPIKLGFVEDSFLRKLLAVHGMPQDAAYTTRMVNFAKECWEVQAKGGMRYQISPRRLFDAVFLLETMKLPLRQALEQSVLAAIDTVSDAQVVKGLIDKV